ncbi:MULTISPECIES: ATP-binding protein [Streptomyces]|uniref:ATP-binding protein n=2 Tax=Streptomyces TaxID=1883 RepID=A0ABV9IJE0_9ACTN
MAQDNHFAVGQELARLRKDAGLTQTDVGRELGRSVGRISQIERGEWADVPDGQLISGYVEHCLAFLDATRDEKKRRRTHLLGLFTALEALADTARRPPAANQLPRDIDTFTGRDDELALLRSHVARAAGAATVIAVHAIDGRPGVGKSAFVTHAAHRLAGRFPDGQLFIDLHGHSATQAPTPPSEALATLLKAVGVPGRDIPASEEERSAMWRRRMADQSALLILDNAADEHQVGPLLPQAPGCLVLITSRRRLSGLSPAPVTIALDVLSPDDAERMLRAAARRDLSEDSPTGELVALCGYLPLAIHLVAGRLRTRRNLTVERLVRELRDGVNRLASLRVRNHHVAAAFELSYRALSSHRQAFFRAVGLHPGPDTDAYAYAALTATSLREAKRQLEGLFDVNLVDEHVYGRFKLHDLIAEYVRDLVATVDPDALRRSLPRLLDYYQDAAFMADRLLGPADAAYAAAYDGPLPDLDARSHALTWLSDERANLLACLRVSAEDPARLLALTTAMTRHLRLSGPWDVAAELHGRARGAAQATHDRHAEARALLELASAHRNHGDYPTAARCADEALGASTALGDDPGTVAALVEKASVDWLTGSYDSSEALLHQALELSRSVDDREGEASVLVELGTLDYFCDRYEDAEQRLGAALRIYEELGRPHSRIRVLKNLGNTWYFMDRYDDAEWALGQALTMARDLGDALVEAQALTKLGSVSRLRGDHEEAVLRLEEARGLARRLADRSLEAELLIDLAVALHRLGRDDEATRAFDDSLTLYTEIGEDIGRACALKESGEVLVATGRLGEGRARLREALDVNERLDERMGTAAVWNAFGRLELAAGDTAAARAAHGTALGIAREIKNPLEEAAALLGLGDTARQDGEPDAAREHLGGSLAIFRRIGAREADDVASRLDGLGGAAPKTTHGPQG